MVKDALSLPDKVKAVIEEITTFDSIKQVDEVTVIDRVVSVTTRWQVTLPNTFKKAGISKIGVKQIEVVVWLVPLDYPLKAPSPRLRADFPTKLPHINPYTKGELIHPCVSEISLKELLHSSGFGAILEATKQWLDNAAADELHCPVQGWESARNDNGSGLIIVDSYSIQTELNSHSRKARYYEYRYFYNEKKNQFVLGNLTTPHLGTGNNSYKEKRVGIDVQSGIRHAPGLLIQTDENTVFDEYHSEHIFNLKALRQFAKSINTEEVFNTRLNYILSLFLPRRTRPQQKISIEEFMIVFAVKRPFNLIGTDSPWELLPYRISINKDQKEKLNDETVVRSTYFMERCNTKLLQAVSGIKSEKHFNVSVLGCGSLGSKISLHLAKTGCYQFELYDNDYFSSHNNARHGLITHDLDPACTSKPGLLSREISKLNVKSVSRNENILNIGKSDDSSLNTKTDFIIDTTASLTVRYFLAHNLEKLPGQLIHSVLYGSAKMGVVAIESKKRTVRVDDLMAFTNTLCISSSSIQKMMYGNVGVQRNHFGDGCSSVTATINDTDISLMAAAMTQKINNHITTREPQLSGGLLNIGICDANTQNLEWRKFEISSTIVISRDSDFEWEIRIFGSVFEEIKQHCMKERFVENGGVLAGQVCSISKTIYVTYLLDAPMGSIGTASNFELKTEGLANSFENIHKKTNSQITFIGTWHSHTSACPPSDKDQQTLKTLQTNYDLPIVMLAYIENELVRVSA